MASRTELRKQALLAWHEGERLRARSRALRASSAELIGNAMVHMLEAERLSDEALRLVNRVIASSVISPPPDAGSVGLIAVRHVDSRVEVRDALSQRLGRVRMAGDAATALGLAILEQPDLAVLDDDLGPVPGTQLAEVLQHYAPATSVLLLSFNSGHKTGTGTRHTGRLKPAGLSSAIDAMLASR